MLVWLFEIMSNRNQKNMLICLLLTQAVHAMNAQNHNNVISRNSGNILKNLTRTQSYVDHIVTSKLDASVPIRWFYRGIRELYKSVAGPTGLRQGGNKHQKRIPDSTPFPCETSQFRSKVTPTSVHQLMPGDIDIVSAMGDSLTAAVGANAVRLNEKFIENRGLSWSIGGQGTWRTHLTLPNILKSFNSNLFGYSLADSYSTHRSSQFNVAENIAATSDMPYNAVKLFNRMKSDPRVNMTHHWKVLTLMIGGNDFCTDICYQTNATDWINASQENSLMKTLLFLRDNMPRTLVNLVPPPLSVLTDKLPDVYLGCNLNRQIVCSCRFRPAYSKDQDLFHQLESGFIRIMKQISYRPELNTKDFTVVYQPFLEEGSIRYMDKNGKADMSLMALDCVHFSQKGHAVVANGLWNNMLEPIGSKTLGVSKLWREFKCPTLQNPYFYTNYNRR